MHDTPSECVLQMYEVSSKYLLQFLSYRVCQTDRHKGKTICRPSFQGGDIITAFKETKSATMNIFGKKIFFSF